MGLRKRNVDLFGDSHRFQVWHQSRAPSVLFLQLLQIFLPFVFLLQLQMSGFDAAQPVGSVGVVFALRFGDLHVVSVTGPTTLAVVTCAVTVTVQSRNRHATRKPGH